MSNERKLPALNWLGRTIDLTSQSPFDIESVKLSVKHHRVIQIDKDKETRFVKIGGIEYELPKIVSASEDSAGISNDFHTYPTGGDAFYGLRTDPGATNHLAVLVNGSEDNANPLKAALPSRFQFAFFSFNADFYTANVRDYTDFVNKRDLLEKVSQLPVMDARNADAVPAYEKFFEEFGSHVITGATFGARCHLTAWGSNHYSRVNENWVRDVTASVHGINRGGRYDESTLDERQYKIFDDIAGRHLTVRGGDSDKAVSLLQGHYDFNALKEWSKTALDETVLVSLRVIELWDLMRDSDDSRLHDYADRVEEAFKAVQSKRSEEKVSTLVIFECDTEAGEIGLLSPGAIIGVGGPLPTFDPTSQSVLGLSETKIRWGKPGSKKHAVIPFYIVNDGSPVDLYIRSAPGKARFIINGTTYHNEHHSEYAEDECNATAAVTKWFYHISVARVQSDEDEEDEDE